MPQTCQHNSNPAIVVNRICQVLNPHRACSVTYQRDMLSGTVEVRVVLLLPCCLQHREQYSLGPSNDGATLVSPTHLAGWKRVLCLWIRPGSRGTPETETGTCVQAVSEEEGGEYMLAASRRCCVAASAGEAGCRPSQHERSFLQPTADSACSDSNGAPGACSPSHISCVAPAQPLIASTCTPKHVFLKQASQGQKRVGSLW